VTQASVPANYTISLVLAYILQTISFMAKSSTYQVYFIENTLKQNGSFIKQTMLLLIRRIIVALLQGIFFKSKQNQITEVSNHITQHELQIILPA
jgi:hypothetical protein